jgi:hypothetical protein
VILCGWSFYFHKARFGFEKQTISVMHIASSVESFIDPLRQRPAARIRGERIAVRYELPGIGRLRLTGRGP